MPLALACSQQKNSLISWLDEHVYTPDNTLIEGEAELQTLWSAPETRKRLLAELAQHGFGYEQLAEMQRTKVRRVSSGVPGRARTCNLLIRSQVHTQ
jgi:hypothetical protein